MLISVEHELEKVRKNFSELGDKKTKKAIVQSLGQIGSKAFTYSAKMMKKYTGIPTGKLKGGNQEGASRPIMKPIKPNANRLWFEINVKSKWLHISEPYFNPRQTRRGVSSKYYSKIKTHKGSFLAKGQSSQKIIAFIRTDKMKDVKGKRKTLKRAIIKPVWAFNPANEFMKHRISENVIQTYTPQIIERYETKLMQYINAKSTKN